MSTTSEFGDQDSESSSSTDGSFAGTASHPVSATPISPRKRRRSSSGDSLRGRKRYLDGRYNNAYRLLYNDTVTAASIRFVADATFQPYEAKIGVSRWSTNEKSVFFAALERLGRDDVPGIARAIGTKSIPETRYFLLLIQEACSQNDAKRRNTRVTLQDIPATPEVGIDCEARLELAGDALAWYQERFEAKQEQERYGKYWLITPEIAEKIEKALEASMSTASSLGDEHQDDVSDTPAAQVLQNIPEAELLKSSMLLHLSKHYFMNPSPNNPYPWPHWEDLISELAAEPSIYYTAFKDLHTLVVSLTRRLVQTAIIQATARIRTQGWRAKKGLSPYVKRRDVLTTVDILGLSRNSSERWRGVARRCGLRVKKSIRRVGGRGDKRSVEVTWDEVERLLDSTNILAEVPSTDAETAGVTSGTDDDNFRSRAVRGGTPLPTTRRALPADSEDDHSIPLEEVDDSDSDMYQPSDDQALDTSMLDDALLDANDSRNLSDVELDVLEAFDQAASREEERRLWSLLDVAPTIGGELSQPKAETPEPEVKNAISTLIYNPADDWRSWTEYRAAWEEMHTPVPLSSFLANARSVTPTPPVRSIEQHESNTDLETRQSSGRDGTGVQSRKGSKADLPIRGARAYAAMQQRVYTSVDGAAESDAEGADGVETLVRSIEVVDEDEVSVGVSENDAMDLD